MRRPSLSLWIAGLLLALPAALTAQTATARLHSVLHSDSSSISTPVESVEPGTKLTLLALNHPNGYYNVRAPDGQVGWVYGRRIELDPTSSAPSDPIQFQMGVDGSADTEGCGDGRWQHVYNPARLEVKAQCVTVTGTIEDATAPQATHHPDGSRHEPDGDTHGWLKPDPQFEYLLNDGNKSDEDGNLVFEIVCHYTVSYDKAKPACKGYEDHTVIPPVGTHVSITGTFVQDNRHAKWNEIHPVTKIVVQ